MTTDLTPTNILYRPGQKCCSWVWHAGDRWELVESLSTCPMWLLAGEDGAVLAVWREGDEVNGYARDPGGRIRMAWDMADPPRSRGEPMGRVDWKPVADQATDVELRVLNSVLRPVALAADWGDELAACWPCGHDDRWCRRLDRPGDE